MAGAREQADGLRLSIGRSESSSEESESGGTHVVLSKDCVLRRRRGKEREVRDRREEKTRREMRSKSEANQTRLENERWKSRSRGRNVRSVGWNVGLGRRKTPRLAWGRSREGSRGYRKLVKRLDANDTRAPWRVQCSGSLIDSILTRPHAPFVVRCTHSRPLTDLNKHPNCRPRARKTTLNRRHQAVLDLIALQILVLPRLDPLHSLVPLQLFPLRPTSQRTKDIEQNQAREHTSMNSQRPRSREIVFER